MNPDVQGNQPSQNTSYDEHEGEMTFRQLEYTAIMGEILQYQRLRVQILAFTVAALGVLIGIPVNGVLKEIVIAQPDIADIARLSGILYLLSGAPYMILIPSAVLTGILCQHILVLDAFIAVRHEAETNFIGWTLTRYAQEKFRTKLNIPRGFRTTSALGFTIAYSILGIFALVYSYFTCIYIFELLHMPTSLTSCNMLLMISINVVLMFVLGFFIFKWIASIKPRTNKEKRMKGFMDARQLLLNKNERLAVWLTTQLKNSDNS